AGAEGVVVAGAAAETLVLDRALTVAGMAAIAAMGGGSPGGFPTGGFSIIDWTGYPSGVPKPDGPFRLLPKGPQYDAARDAANAANKKIRADNPDLRDLGLEVHEN